MDKPTHDKRPDRTQDRPYQIVAYLGTGAVPPLSDVKVVNLAVSGPLAMAAPFADETAPSEAHSDAAPAAVADAGTGSAEAPAAHPAIAVLAATGLAAADVRSRILVLCDATVAADRAVVSYAVFSAFCGRRLDVAFAATLTDLVAEDTHARNLPASVKPETRAELVVVSDAPASHPALAGATTIPTSSWSPDDVATLRWARRVVLVPADDPVAAIRDFVRVAAVRARGDQDRFPHLLAADGVVDVDALRRVALESRRARRGDQLMPLAERADAPSRSRDLMAACAVPVEAVMVALGSTTPGEGLWHCPRPTRHANGDQNASMRVERSKGRCFLCDAERVDAVRLVADVRGWSTDEAAEWVLAEVAPNAERLVATVADRLPKPE